jgi:hypothetical protein
MKPEVRMQLELMRERLEKLSRGEISKMGWRDLEPITIDGNEYEPSVWSDTYKGKLLLVVQVYRRLSFFLATTDCIGSLIGDDGEVTHVDEKFLMNEMGYP